MMQDIGTALLGALVVLICVYFGFIFGQTFQDRILLNKIEELEDEIVNLRNPHIAEPHKFRIRTAQSDPSRHARVTKARVRAKRYPRPDPRK